MDAADRASMQECAQGVCHADPLRGVDVAMEYERIGRGKSVLCDRVQKMVVDRWELGI